MGDCIDYGMRSNEVIEELRQLESCSWNGKIMVNLWGNHEKLMRDKDLEHLSSDRGRVMANYTRRHLTQTTLDYIENRMNPNGYAEFNLEGMDAFAVHGSCEDYYWKAILPDNLHGDYRKHSIVFPDILIIRIVLQSFMMLRMKYCEIKRQLFSLTPVLLDSQEIKIHVHSMRFYTCRRKGRN